MRKSGNDLDYLTKAEIDVIGILSQHGTCTLHRALDILCDSKSNILVLRAMHDLLDKKILSRVKIGGQQFYSLRKPQSSRIKLLTKLSLQSLA